MNFLSGIFNGLAEVWSHKLRSLLTMICVCLGVASLVVIVGLLNGLVASWNEWFVEFGGLEKIEISAQEIAEDQKQTLYSTLTMRDANAIRQTSVHAAFVSPEIYLEETLIKRKGKFCRLAADGVVPDAKAVNKYDVAHGRFITDADNAGYEDVAVLGSAAVEALYEKNEPVIGSTIAIKGAPFTVVGVLKKYELMQEGANVLHQKNEIVFVPLSAMQKRLAGVSELSSINVRVDRAANLRKVVNQLTSVLLQIHRDKRGYKIETSERMKEGLVKSERSYFQVGTAVGAVSLLVGGIGIMNLMLASINERVREIGVRKAIGAWAWDIFVQFLAEAIVLSLLGGVLGIVAGTLAIEYLRHTLADSSPPIVSLAAIVVGFSISVAIGIIAGIYPAFRASRLDPIEALRYE